MPRQLSRTVQPSFAGCLVVASQPLNAHFVIGIISSLRGHFHRMQQFRTAHGAIDVGLSGWLWLRWRRKPITVDK
jgi:hypothetical protein